MVFFPFPITVTDAARESSRDAGHIFFSGYLNIQSVSLSMGEKPLAALLL